MSEKVKKGEKRKVEKTKKESRKDGKRRQVKKRKKLFSDKRNSAVKGGVKTHFKWNVRVLQ